jgi:hypothetical protein
MPTKYHKQKQRIENKFILRPVVHMFITLVFLMFLNMNNLRIYCKIVVGAICRNISYERVRSKIK